MQDTPLRGDVIPYIPPVNNPPQGPGGPGPGPQGHPGTMGSMNHPGGPGGPGPPPNMEWRPVFLCGDKAFIIDGPMARPAPPELLRRELAKTPLGKDLLYYLNVKLKFVFT